MVHLRNGSPNADGSPASRRGARERVLRSSMPSVSDERSYNQTILLAVENVGCLGKKSGITPVNLLATNVVVGSDGGTLCPSGMVK